MVDGGHSSPYSDDKVYSLKLSPVYSFKEDSLETNNLWTFYMLFIPLKLLRLP